MAQFCNNCGAELIPGTAFCTNCGAKGPAPEPQPDPWAASQPTQTIPTAPAAPPTTPEPAAYGEPPVGTGTFFWLMLLFGLPVLGQLVCIILCFVPKRKSLRSFARASLIWCIIGLILALVLGFAAKALLQAAIPYLEELTNADLDELWKLIGQMER